MSENTTPAPFDASTPRVEAVLRFDDDGDAKDLVTLARELERENTALVERVMQFDQCIRAVANELGAGACGGVDGNQLNPLSTTRVLLDALRKLKPDTP